VRVSLAEFRALDLEAHALLHDVPLRDVTALDLPNGGSGRSVADVRRLLLATREEPSGASGALLRLRWFLGRVFDWDRPISEPSYADRLSDALRQRTRKPTGSADGPFTLLYELENESLSEVRNATVHAFACMVLVPRPGGYRFYLGVYVKPVSRLTPLYMAAIEPFRRFIVYPALMKRLRVGGSSASSRVRRFRIIPRASHPATK
jgi:hypothetical protein